MNSKNLVVICICVTVIVLSIAVSIYFQTKEQSSNNYSVVYLTSGEVYVGKLSSFPRLTLTDAYLIQIVKDATDQTKSSFQLAPLSQTIWSPKKLYINDEQVIFSGPINETSQVVQTIKNGSSVPK
jgi:hypothetical protein